MSRTESGHWLAFLLLPSHRPSLPCSDNHIIGPVRIVNPTDGYSMRYGHRGMMATTANKRRESQQRTEKRLLEVAERVFAKRGYRAATVAEVAREAGYTTGAVYSNFSGKEDLFLAVAARQAAARSSVTGTIRERMEGETGLEDAFRQQFAELLASYPEWPVLLYEFWSTAIRDARLRRRFREIRGLAREAIAEPLREAEREGRLRRGYTSEAIAAMLLASISGLAFEHAADPEAVPIEHAAFAFAAIVRAAVEPRRPVAVPRG